MKPLFHKALLAAAGILCGLLSLEAGLRLSGAYFRHSAAARRASPSAKINILCAGDSFTYGMGAPLGSSYPDHLQRLLDLKYGAGIFSVTNAGVLGENSSQLADRIDFLLARNRPDILLILTGSVNYNLRGSNFFLLAAEDQPLPRRIALKTDQYLSHLKVYKFLELGTKQLLSKIERRTYKAKPCLPETREILAAYTAAFDRKDYGKAAAMLDGALQKDGNCAELNFQRGRMWFYYRDFPKAFSYLKKGRDLDPRHPYVGVFLSQEISLLNMEYASGILDKVLKYDLEFIGRSAARTGTTTFYQTYPFGDSRRDWIREAAAAKAKTALINHHTVFIPLMSGGKVRDYLSKDEPDLLSSHPNSAGYQLMAENIVETFKTLDIFKRQNSVSGATP